MWLLCEKIYFIDLSRGNKMANIWFERHKNHLRRDVPNPNNSTESEFIRKRIVPFLINRIENMNIRIQLLINRIGVWSIRVIPIRNRIHSLNIPYQPNNNWIFQRVKNMNKASTIKVILNLSNFQPEKILFLTST